MKKNIIVHNKLVRDLIPNVITDAGKSFDSHIADKQEYADKLYEKLKEETNEFLNDPCPEEIADILEVIDAIIKLNEYTDVHEIKEAKNNKRGKFDKRIILESVWKEDE